MNIFIILPTKENTVKNIKKYKFKSIDTPTINTEWSYVIFDELSREELLQKIMYYCGELEDDLYYAISQRDFSRKFEKDFNFSKNTIIKGISLVNSILTDDEYKLYKKICSSQKNIEKLIFRYKYQKELWLS